MKSEKNIVKQEKEQKDTFDRFIKESLGKEPFPSFSRASDSSYQLIQLLNAFDIRDSGSLCRSSKEENFEELKENFLDNCVGTNTMLSKKNGVKESADSRKVCGQPSKESRSSSTIRPLKIPEAVVAFAQAAAKANGEPEKYLPGWSLLSPSKRQMKKCDKCSRDFCSSINYRRHMRLHRRSLNVHKDSPRNRDLLGEFWDKLSVCEAKELVSLKNVNMEDLSGSSVIKALSTWIRRPAILSSLPHVYVKAGLRLLEFVQETSSVFPVTSRQLFCLLDDASENTFLCAGTALSVQKYVFDGEAVKTALEIQNLVALTSFLIEKELVKAWLADKDAEALRCQKLLVEEEEAAQRRQAELSEAKRLKKLRLREQKAKHASSILSKESSSEASIHGQHQQILDDSENVNVGPGGTNGETSPRLPSPPSDEAAQDMVRKIQGDDVHQQQYSSRNGQASAYAYAYRRHNNRDPRRRRPVAPPNGVKVWSVKLMPEPKEDDEIDSCCTVDNTSGRSQVLIGSINVTLKTGAKQTTTAKLWRRVVRHGNSDEATHDLVSPPVHFSSEAAKAFLARRWKAAVAGEHLVLSCATEEDLGRSDGCGRPEKTIGLSSSSSSSSNHEIGLSSSSSSSSNHEIGLSSSSSSLCFQA